MNSPQRQRILEIFHRTTASGRRVAWDEPGEGDTPEVRRHNAFLAKQLQKKQNAKDRLISKGAVPTKNGNPIFESDKVNEDVHQVKMSFRRQYQSIQPMHFRDWIRMVAEMLDKP